MNRNYSVNIRVTKEEKDQILKMAKEEHTTTATFIRMRIFRKNKGGNKNERTRDDRERLEKT
jgi:hypothetical protein